MKIKSQILVAVSGIFVLVAGTVSVEMVLVGYNKAQQGMGDLKSLSVISLLEARKSESEFLSKPDEALIKKNREHMGKLRSYLDTLLADEKTSSAEYKNLSEIATEVRRYEELYSKIVSNQTRMGFTDNLGLRGEMREAAHKVEAAFKGKSDYLFAGLLQARRHEKDFLMRGDTNIAQKLTASVADLKQRMWYSGLGGRTDLVTLLDEYQTKFLEIVAGQTEIKNLIKDFTDEMSQVQPQLAAYGAVIDARIARNYTVIRVTEVVSVLVLLAFFIFLAWFAPRYFAKPILRLKETAERIASGDLTGEPLELGRKDELGDLANSFNLMSGNLKNLLGEVAESVDQVAAGANQIAASSQALSQGSTEQASSLEEIAASATEITAQTNQNAQSAQKASRMSAEAREKAEQGNREMQELLSEMERISKSSDEVKKIVKVIDDIAFQTNLLALNANVEAARAGKYGRGFAVVAEEVRNLAARSAESAMETTRMVEAILKNVASGNAKAEKTSLQLTEIVDGAMKVSELVEEINRASVEQTSALEQIQKGLSEIEIVTQSTVTQAEEGASASEELSAQAKSLRQIISQFKTEKEDRQDKGHVENKNAARIHQTNGNGNGNGNGHSNGKSHALKSIALVTTDHNGKAHRSSKDVIHLENGDYQGF